MAAIAQFERALIGDRVRSGLARARALGKTIGRPRSRVSSLAGHEILALRAQGLSYWVLAQRLDISPALAHAFLAHLTLAPGPDIPGPALPQPDHSAATP
jgi:DNA invertase Pin-like site-specific DNA recombinase